MGLLIRLITRTAHLSIQISRLPPRHYSYSTPIYHDPLRILFCGSDEFSIASLRALHAEREKDYKLIASLDVVCRPGKRVGRGLKKIKDVPIAGVARELSLPLHQIDTFTKWEPPKPRGLPINLVVAVSFGLLVPPRILQGARYGGLNVHPSILPDFHGPAPLHHTLLSRCERTGITLQTLHPKHFDEGTIIAQTPLPGFEHRSQTVEELLAVTAPKGAEMLVQSIRDGTFLPPFENRRSAHGEHQTVGIRAAPKITPNDRHIDWNSWTADEILIRSRVSGPLWNVIDSTESAQTRERRIIWSTGFVLATDIPKLQLLPGHIAVATADCFPKRTILKTCDGQYLQADAVKIDGGNQEDPVHALRRIGIHLEREEGITMT